MQNVRILGITLQDRSLQETLSTANRYLTNGALDIVAYVDHDVLTQASKNEKVKGFVNRAGMTLWEDKKILKIVGISDAQRYTEVESRAFINELLSGIVNDGRSISIASKDQESLNKLHGELVDFIPNLKIVHETKIESTGGRIPENEINLINEHAPAIVICRADYALQQEWLTGASNMINAGIWLALPAGMSIQGSGSNRLICRIWQKLSFRLFKRRATRAMEG